MEILPNMENLFSLMKNLELSHSHIYQSTQRSLLKNHVDFFVDDELMESDDLYPYQWTYKKINLLRIKHTIKVIAYDNDGKSATDEIELIKFL